MNTRKFKEIIRIIFKIFLFFIGLNILITSVVFIIKTELDSKKIESEYYLNIKKLERY